VKDDGGLRVEPDDRYKTGVGREAVNVRKKLAFVVTDTNHWQ
jgi:hypothetical protein